MIAPTIPDTRDVFQSTADYLFDVAAHLNACGRHLDANNVLRAALEMAIRATFLGCGKKSCVLSSDKMLNILRCNMTLDKATFKDARKLMGNHTLTESATRRLVCKLRKGAPADLNAVGDARNRDEARQVYTGVTQPHPNCRSVVNQRRRGRQS